MALLLERLLNQWASLQDFFRETYEKFKRSQDVHKETINKNHTTMEKEKASNLAKTSSSSASKGTGNYLAINKDKQLHNSNASGTNN